MSDFQNDARVSIYRHIVEFGKVPQVRELAAFMGSPAPLVSEALRELAVKHALVLQPDGEILMANPFSAVPTSFEVQAGERRWWGNCIWDSLGILAAVQTDGSIQTACGCCGLAMQVEVRSSAVAGPGIAHFAVPAKRWWDDIVFN